jgi:hypothetical protein
VNALVDSSSSGQSGAPLTIGASAALASYDAAPQRTAPTSRRRSGIASYPVCAKRPPLKYEAPLGTRGRRGDTAPVTGFTLKESEVRPSK